MTGISTGTIATPDTSSGSGRNTDGSTVTARTNEQQTLPATPMTILPAKRAGLADIGDSNAELIQQTEKRNEAASVARQQSGTLLNTAMELIAKQNGANGQAIQAAQAAIAQIMSRGKSSPKVIGSATTSMGQRTSSGRQGSAASFNSMANTLRSFF